MLAFFNWVLSFTKQFTTAVLQLPFYGDVTLGYLFIAISVMGLLFRFLIGRLR